MNPVIQHVSIIQDTSVVSIIMQIYTSLFQFPTPTFYGSMPISLMPESILHITETTPTQTKFFMYNVTMKLDGMRMLLLIDSLLPTRGHCVFINRNMEFYELNQTDDFNIVPRHTYLFDGEFYATTFYIFDMLYNDKNYVDLPFEIRHRDMYALLTSTAFQAMHLNVQYKVYFDMNEFTSLRRDLYITIQQRFKNYYKQTRHTDFEFDGLIFTPRFTKYAPPPNWKYPGNILYKWKPDETIDFQLARIPSMNDTQWYAHVASYKKIEPFFYWKNNQRVFFPIDVRTLTNFKPSNIYECSYNKQTRRFDIIRDRSSEKTTPNRLRTAQSAWKLITYDINIDVILPLINDTASLNDRVRSLHTLPEWSLKQILMTCSENVSIIKEKDPFMGRFRRQMQLLPSNDLIHVEFEIRIGRILQNATTKKFNFDPNIAPSHFTWLKTTLINQQIPHVYHETIDVFDNNLFRTTYFTQPSLYMSPNNSIRKTIIKHRQQIKEINDFRTLYGYDLRLSVSAEETIPDYKIVHDLSTIEYRKKQRTSFCMNAYYDIDMTEYTTHKSNTPSYQIEIELKKKKHNLRTLNNILKLVLTNLYGNSELI
jgi:hypothetical protein